jgi:hypothetical protein
VKISWHTGVPRNTGCVSLLYANVWYIAYSEEEPKNHVINNHSKQKIDGRKREGTKKNERMKESRENERMKVRKREKEEEGNKTQKNRKKSIKNSAANPVLHYLPLMNSTRLQTAPDTCGIKSVTR